MAAQRRKRGSGTIQSDKTRNDFVARTADKSRTGRFATRKDAEKALDTWNAQIARGVDLAGNRQSVQVFCSAWLADVAPKRTKQRTLEFYRRHLSYAIAQLGHIPIGDLNPQQIDKALNVLGAAGLSPRSVAHVRSVLHNALKTACKWGFLESNPVKLSDAPAIPGKDDRTLEPEQIDGLLNAIQGHRLEALFELLIALGCRPNELIGLRWADIDAAARTINIRDSKTVSGIRLMPLTSTLVERLQAHWQNQQEERSVLGVKWREHGLVFPSEVGTPLGYRNVVRAFKALCKRAGLPETTQLYDLRRTAISTWIVDGGADPRTAQSLAGHSDPAISQGVYARSKLATQRAALEAVEERRKRRA